MSRALKHHGVSRRRLGPGHGGWFLLGLVKQRCGRVTMLNLEK
ncbi:MAG TPA: hypothetical protein PLM33_02520 [Acidobacteriota bacterium]|nr:hypothetical protein [Acidobacteriota bacterium]